MAATLALPLLPAAAIASPEPTWGFYTCAMSAEVVDRRAYRTYLSFILDDDVFLDTLAWTMPRERGRGALFCLNIKRSDHARPATALLSLGEFPLCHRMELKTIGSTGAWIEQKSMHDAFVDQLTELRQDLTASRIPESRRETILRRNAAVFQRVGALFRGKALS